MARNNLRLAFLLLAGLLLGGCASDEFTDLDEFMEQKRSRPSGVIPPIPAFKTYQAFTYSATTLRSPFDRPVEIREIEQLQAISAVQPDDNRPKEFLEQFTFDSLAMVGSLAKGGTDWTLIRDPDGGVHRVKLGNYLGRNHGRIVEMTQSYVAVIEIVSDGGEGWLERPRSIKLKGLN
jgi:type IV pilus assembly protein PilP